MFTSVRKLFKPGLLFLIAGIVIGAFFLAKKKYSQADFGKQFNGKYQKASLILHALEPKLAECSKLCNYSPVFLQSLVMPEVMRYNSLKDGIEAESLRTLYVQFGEEYADFSIGIFQMKPSFAQVVEKKVEVLLPGHLQKEFAMQYSSSNAEEIRRHRVERLQDEDWQLNYLTAFTVLCDTLYKQKKITSELQKLLWYATVYNAGFDKSDAFIEKKLVQSHYYLEQDMPEKKFNYAAIVEWYYKLQNKGVNR